MKKIFVVMFVAALTMAVAGTAFAKVLSGSVLSPIADSPVDSGWSDTNFNGYGLATDPQYATLDAELWTGSFYGGDQTTRSYLKFNLAPYSSSQIQSATLWLYKGSNYGGAADVASYGTLNNWTENGITWNNAPVLGAPGGTKNVGAETGWYSWDVTSLANAAKGGEFSLALASAGIGQVYYQRETGTGNAPYLSVTAVPEPVSTVLFLIGGATLAVRRVYKSKKS